MDCVGFLSYLTELFNCTDHTSYTTPRVLNQGCLCWRGSAGIFHADKDRIASNEIIFSGDKVSTWK
jgi:hypothetical protein